MGTPFSADITLWLLIFARVGAIMMLLPGFGDEALPAKVKLIFGLLLSLILYPSLLPRLPEIGALDPLLAPLVVQEVVIGLMLGALLRLAHSAIMIGGSIIGLQSGLSMAMVFDPSAGGQNSVIARFMGVGALVLIFALNIDHLLIGGLLRSYTIFAPGGRLMAGDMAQVAIQTMAQAFAVGVQLSAPFLLYGLVFNMGLGLVSRLTPSVQIFFIAQPLNHLLAFAILLATMGLMLALFARFFAEAVKGLMG